MCERRSIIGDPLNGDQVGSPAWRISELNTAAGVVDGAESRAEFREGVNRDLPVKKKYFKSTGEFYSQVRGWCRWHTLD
jgi:hypothetical protein